MWLIFFTPLGDVEAILGAISQGKGVRPLAAKEDVTQWTAIQLVSVTLEEE